MVFREAKSLNLNNMSFGVEYAVSVRNLSKSFSKGNLTLSNLCMNVPKGTIYGLLGSSGCGKTTLLSCIVGLLKWDLGTILMLGGSEDYCKRKVGYMPQSISLHEHLSAHETISYYGRIYGMTKKEIQEKWSWLVNFLKLPHNGVLIKNLSGGEQRRVSLGVAFVHSPELLILDEPTVGLDPLLRESIWKYLREMVTTEKLTVIISTHYVEEARTSDKIGVIRDGYLMVEDSPMSLLVKYKCNSLDQVLLQLCKSDMQNRTTRAISDDKTATQVAYRNKNATHQWNRKTQRTQIYGLKNRTNTATSINRIWALITVTWLLFLRHMGFLIMILMLPLFEIVLNFAIVGKTPQGLKIGVVNFEVPWDTCVGSVTDNAHFMALNNSLNLEYFSCSLIAELNSSGTLEMVPRNSTEIALQDVEMGRLWGYISFPSNFTQHTTDLGMLTKFSKGETILGSRVEMKLDMSNFIVSYAAISDVHKSYGRFVTNVASTNDDSARFESPLKFKDPVYGKFGATLEEYFIPMVIICLSFQIPSLITSVLLIYDRKNGTRDRARVAGVDLKDIMISHIVTHGSIIILQIAIINIALYFIYAIRLSGSYGTFFLICILGGLTGQGLGLAMGALLENEIEAILLGCLLAFNISLWQGFLWPVQAMTSLVQRISYFSPAALITEAAKSVMYKGAGLVSILVWPGIVASLIWTALFWILFFVLS